MSSGSAGKISPATTGRKASTASPSAEQNKLLSYKKSPVTISNQSTAKKPPIAKLQSDANEDGTESGTGASVAMENKQATQEQTQAPAKPEPDSKPVPAATTCKSNDDTSQYIANRLNAIRSYENKGFDNQVVLDNLQGIRRVYHDLKRYRTAALKAMVDNQFGPLSKKMMDYFNQKGLFSSDNVWFSAYYTFSNMWNYSDVSKIVSLQLADAGVVPMLIANITHKPYLDNFDTKNCLYAVKASLSILSNIVRSAPETKYLYTENNAVEAVKPLLKASDDFVKLIAMMLLTNIISEEENAALEDTGAIYYTITCLSSALKSPKRRFRGFDPVELVEGLGRMAVNDANKMKIVNKGALPLLVKILKHNDPEEQFATVRCLWTLSFGEEARKYIKAEPNCMEELERLSKLADSKLVHEVKGALWILKDEAQTKEKEREEARRNSTVEIEKPKDHIFISYNWDHQEVVLNLRDRLKADGYRVWIDVDQMGGSTLEAMAEAVENASVVLLGLSEKYKLSPNCRTEAEYTFQLHKQIVPLMMQRRYRADGWLGMLVGAKLYVNFDGKHSFDDAYLMLVKEIAGRGKEGGESGALIPASATATTPAARGRSSEVMGWSKNQVFTWLDEHDLGGLKSSFADFDGKQLVRFNKIRHEAPEFFYRALHEQVNKNTSSLCKFSEALDELLR